MLPVESKGDNDLCIGGQRLSRRGVNLSAGGSLVTRAKKTNLLNLQMTVNLSALLNYSEHTHIK